MILTLSEVKGFLRIDETKTDDDMFLNSLITACEEFIVYKTGKPFNATSELSKLLAKVIISDWYDNRSLYNEKKNSEKVRFTISSIINQLTWSD